jgi:adenylosuccinate lyase
MMGLAPHVGRQKAHDAVYEACQEAVQSKVSLLEALCHSKDIVGAMGMDELTKLCDPVNYLGSSTRMVEDVLALKK